MADYLLAFDLGAESGRAILGKIDGQKKLKLEEVHRFDTGKIIIQKHYYWNLYRFYEEIIKALKKCTNDPDMIPESVGVDTWGVDFGLLGKDGSILRLPYCYRDPRTETSMPAFLERMDRWDIYEATGLGLHKYNSLYQLYAMVMANDPVLQIADKLLFMPDLINYLLTGETKSEFTFATTTQLFNPNLMKWDERLFRKLGIGMEIMQEVILPGEQIGEVNPVISRSIDVEGIKVMSVASHDTASAIVSVPAEGENWAYISSGIWSLMGVESKSAIIDQRSMMFNFSNEGGAQGTFRFLKNIMGLWLLQQCKASWEKTEGFIDYSEIVEMASKASPFAAMVDPDYPGFYNPLEMPVTIDTFCRQSGQIMPDNKGSVARTIFESLAMKYRMVADQLELVTGRNINVIHIIGGGAKNKLLSQFTANATGRKVITGPDEATAIGNILMQAIGLGKIENLNEARQVVRNSFQLEEFEPEDEGQWKTAYEKFKKIAKQN
ncbi:MAG TPA: rhamnulokinase family protein [Bacteroidales bacterium]|nr:rhamnulokinase family protein [Bacteroidales bacterium]